MIKRYWKRIVVYLIALDVVVLGIMPIIGIVIWGEGG